MGKQPQLPVQKPPRSHQVINQAALILCLYLVIMGVLRLLTVLFSNDVLPLRPVDGWFLMSIRGIAVCFSLVLFLVSKLRRRYLLLIFSMVMLTSAGLWLRLASLLPENLQPAAGVLQLLMAVVGMTLIIAGIFQGEDLASFIKDTWALSGKQAMQKLWMEDEREP